MGPTGCPVTEARSQALYAGSLHAEQIDNEQHFKRFPEARRLIIDTSLL
jgi:hypothetical protein